jgi:hypothetical protein
VANKLLMLLVPFLSKWTYARMHEQVCNLDGWRCCSSLVQQAPAQQLCRAAPTRAAAVSRQR